MKHVLSIRAMLITIIVVCMAPIFVTAVYESASEERIALKEAQLDLAHHAQLRDVAHEHLLESVHQVLQTAAHSALPLLGDPGRCGAYLRDIDEHFPDFPAMGVADPGGTIICSSTEGVTANIAERSYFRRAIRTGKFSVGDYAVGVVRGRPSLIFGFPMYADGRLKGVLYALMDNDAIQRKFAQTHSPPGVSEFLMDSSGATLASLPSGAALIGKPVPDSFIRALAPALEPHEGYSFARDGRLYAIRQVKPPGGGSLTVVASVSTESVLVPVRARLWQILAGLVLVTLVSSAIAWHVAEKLVGRPIEHVLEDLQAVERGHASRVRATTDAHWQVHELARIKGSVKHVAETLAARASQRDFAIAALERSERRYRAQFDAAPQPMWVYDIETLEFLQVNEAAVVHYGYSRDEFMAMTLRDIRPAEDVPGFLDLIAGHHRTVQNEASARHKTKGGQVINVELAGHAVEWEGRSARMVIAYDVTSRVKAAQAWQRLTQTLEAQVQKRTRELEEANKELEAFSYSVSHDLRNPIAGIQAFCAALARRYGGSLPEEAAQYVERISAGAAQMNLLIADLLSLSRVGRETVRIERVDVAEAAATVVEGLRERFPARAVDVSIDEVIEVWGDRRLIGIVLENLIGNAWKFTARAQGAIICIEGQASDGNEGFVVADNGAGFDSAQAHRLFQPFQRLHSEREFEGTGIGLAIVQRIVKRLDGHVWAESAPGKGARFHVCLPAAGGKAAPDSVPAAEIA